jgi:hypothetical protein
MKKLFAIALMLATPTVANAKPVSFLEAALFFLTAIEPVPEDVVSDSRIALSKYPIVAYLVEDNPSCQVRLRTTIQPYTVWQMDFCKLVRYEWRGNAWAFIGKPGAFCRGALAKDEDYMDTIWKLDDPNNVVVKSPINMSSPLSCDLGTAPDFEKDKTGPYSLAVAFQGTLDMSKFIELNKVYGLRSQSRLLESMKYIDTLLTPPERRKPY